MVRNQKARYRDLVMATIKRTKSYETDVWLRLYMFKECESEEAREEEEQRRNGLSYTSRPQFRP